QKRAELITLLHTLGKYVLFVAGENRAVAMSSGFSVAKEPSPAPPITKPENLQLKEGDNSGELKVSFTKVAGAKSYLYQYAADPVTEETVWNIQSGTTRQTVLKNLKSGKRYWCKVAAIGRNNQEVCSDAVSHIVQ
ncbi:MAG: fibronectin type III domain-containing protein, partial [Nitrososphaera sp.]|nr:fibronectin type III domain-containing protein [Nitrososphaera sp.]